MHRDLVDHLFVRYRGPVFRFLRRFLRDGQAAEDLTQETFLRALRGRYECDGRERAWIFQIARNLAHDHSRAARRQPPLAQLQDPVAGGDVTLAFELEAALAALAADDREVFLLREVAGLSYDEIATVCGLTPDAVRSRLHRTRLALRASLSRQSPVRGHTHA